MLYPLSYRRRMLTLSKASYALKPRAQFSTYTYLMISARKMKALGLAISTVLLATGCGSKSPATNSDAWTAQQQNSISKRWLPARSLECQLFINMFQNFNTVIAERSTAGTNAQAAAAIKDFQSFTNEATLALNQEIKVTKVKNIKEYSQRFLKFVTALADSKNFDQSKAQNLLIEAKWLIYNPPYDCSNP